MNVFLDINVVLDVFLPDRQEQDASREVLNLISQGILTGYMASFSIATLTYFLQKALKEDAGAAIRLILEQIQIIELSKDDFI